MHTIEINSLSKSFSSTLGKRTPCIQDLSLCVDKGTIAVLIGPNGSGKTTLIKTIIGLLHADEGTIRIADKDMRIPSARASCGFLPEVPYFPTYLNAEEFLRIICELSAMDKKSRNEAVSDVLKKIGLYEQRLVAIKKYSKGMKKRLGLAQAIVTDPDILILDEPLDGLDPRGIHIFTGLMKDMRAVGKTVLFTTHLLNEIEEYADSVAILKAGKIVFRGTINDVKTQSDLNVLYMKYVH